VVENRKKRLLIITVSIYFPDSWGDSKQWINKPYSTANNRHASKMCKRQSQPAKGVGEVAEAGGEDAGEAGY
jgi:hypothetical protein